MARPYDSRRKHRRIRIRYANICSESQSARIYKQTKPRSSHVGFLPLAQLPLLRLLGGDQFRKFCVVAIIILVATVWITCFTQAEKERPSTHKSQGYIPPHPGLFVRMIVGADMRLSRKMTDVLNNIYVAIVKLPKPIRRVCYVQVFAFMGW